ncbi:Retrovirus-related Pol poly from transposon, partial [Paramuricea clavata]
NKPRLATHLTNHIEDDLNDDDILVADDDEKPSSEIAPLPLVQAILDERNDNTSKATNQPSFKTRVQAGIPGLRQNPIRNFGRGEMHSTCDLDGLDLPKAWKLPIRPLSSHLEIDINNLQKANAIMKFSGDIHDYMNWRASFLETVHFKVKESAARKITVLSNMLPVEVFNKISRGHTYSADGYAARIRNLEKDFGDGSMLYNVVWNNLTKVPYVGNMKQTNNLEKFISTFDEFVNHAKILNIGHDDKLVFSIVTAKFDEDIVLKFKSQSRLMGMEVNASNFRNWLDDKLQDILSLPGTSGTKCPICKKDGHLAEACKAFLQEPIKERLKLVRNHQLCFLCLKEGHLASACTEAKKCFCGRDHHPRLHRDVHGKVQNVKTFISIETEAYETEVVEVENPTTGKKRLLNALMDSGADRNSFDLKIARDLKLEGDKVPFAINGVGGVVTSYQGLISDLIIRNVTTRQFSRKITVQCFPEPAGKITPTPITMLKSKFKHLNDIEVTDFIKEPVTLIIGNDNPSLQLSLEEREGSSTQPFGRLYNLGWCVYGPITSGNTAFPAVNENHFVDINEADYSIPKELSKDWLSWLQQTDKLSEFEIDRCLENAFTTTTAISRQIHVFADASLSAYACVLYMRIQYQDLTITTNLIFCKAK